MDSLINGLSWALLLGGSFFLVVGAVGLVRLPDFFTRMHAAGVTDTGGAGLVLLGLMLQGGLSLVTVKLAFILLFILFTSPTACHALAKAALHAGLEPESGNRGAKAPLPRDGTSAGEDTGSRRIAPLPRTEPGEGD